LGLCYYLQLMIGPKKTDWEILAELLARHKRNQLGTPPLSPLAQALLDARNRQNTNPFLPPPNKGLGGALSDLFKTQSTQPAIGGLFGNPGPTPATRPSASPTYAALKPKKRSTFYSFHYADVFRVNHIRKAGAILPTDKERLPTPQDRSLWEKAKDTNPGRLKLMIIRGLVGTTVTTVLAGEHTWERPWVRYEIARSLFKGNGLLTVHIDGCECPRDGFGRRGYNPLSFMALGWNRRIYELNEDGDWVLYDKLTQKVEVWPKWLARPKIGYVMPLSAGAPEYDWINDNGRDNLVHWTHHAAKAAGH
jgi:hypothetical protein